MTPRPIRLVRAFLTVGGWTMASRLLGFVRDIAIAAALGAGPAAQAFVIAFALPNMFRRFFAEGAFNMAFVPMFARRVEAGEDANGFAEEAMALLATLLVLLTLAATAGMPWLVLAMAGGFGDAPAKYALTVDMARIMFPYILLISLAALFSGMLNAVGRFVAAAAAPVLLNVILVAGLGLATALGAAAQDWITWLVLLAGVAQMGMLLACARRAGFALRPRLPRLTPQMRRLARVAVPAALAGGVVQVNLLVGRQVASFFDGAVAWLYYADRLYQLPLGVVGVAIGIVLLPELSRRLQAGDMVQAREAVNRSTAFSLALTLPAALALMVVPSAIVSVLFERGAFTAADARATALAVAIYGAGLPAFVMQKVLSPVFFAREDTRAPFRFALVAMAVNAAVAIGLAPVIGYLSAAVATTAAGWVNMALLWNGARAYGDAATPDATLRRRLPRLLLAALVMAAVLLGLAGALGPALADPALRYPALAGLVLAGMGAYAAACALTGAVTRAELRGALRRGR
ncbi:murein biosynthesis integral membrane protein MurJ [Paroceanicella profunda]|uniref:Probable lipid II flippase MurJ n=1 Tax=Paroceanicella profunda TaxID=2579971 RepID=A0A5B8FX65_9RHOB|nr:murein biosynthesis integral membrane protein MurJ [Paroceanicella profunda]QDL93496.1 murein biosynthesis integral membrane protein MurJ [Paroceanicella profunda]